MGIVFRQSAKNLIIVAAGALMGALVIWLQTKYIPKQGLGFVRSTVNNSIVVSQVLLLGLNSTLVVYIHRFAADLRKSKLLLTITLLLPAVFAVLFSGVFFLFRTWVLHHFQKEDIPLMAEYFNWLPISFLLFIYMTILEQYLGSQMKVAVSAFMREIVLRIINISLIIVYAFGYISLHTLLLFTVLMYAIPVVIFIYLCYKTEGFGFSFRFRDFSGEEYKEIAHFSWYHFLLSITLILMSLMDATLLPFYDHDGFASAAVYGVASFMVSFLLMPSKAFTPASFTALARAFAQKNMEEAKDLFSRASINLIIPTVLIAILLACNVENAVSIIGTGKNYADVTSVFLILMTGTVINIATGMNDQVLTIANYYKFNFYVSVLLIGLFFLMLRFSIPRYGMVAAAWSNAIIMIIFNVIKFFFVWKKLDMQPFSKSTVYVFFAAIPATAAGYFFPSFFSHDHHIYIHTFIDAALRSSAIVIVYTAMVIWLKPSPDLTEYIVSIKKNKRLF